MKITCQSCQAKYTIADEKVLGKVVKIRCKKCQETIVVNGVDVAAQQADGGGYAPGGELDWTVNVADGDQRNMTVDQIADAFRAGVIHEETYCWRDGMEDWLPIREIGELYAASTAAPLPQLSSPDLSFAEAPVNGHAGHANGAPAGMFGGNEPADSGYGADAPVAARRAGGRAAGGDLFGAAALAGAEPDPASMPSSHGTPSVAPEKLTGQRNENSVLFSLAALTDAASSPGVSSQSSSGLSSLQSAGQTTATTDGSGLIDIRALSASMSNTGGMEDKKANVDDIMNLGGGNAFGALAAPILAPSTVDASGMLATEPQKKSNSAVLLVGILGGCAMIAAAIVFVTMYNRSPGVANNTAGAGSAGADTSAIVGSGGDPSAPSASAILADPAGVAIPSTSSSARSPSAGAATTAKTPGAPAGNTGGAAATKTDKPEKSDPAPPPAPAAPKTLEEKMAEASGASGHAPKVEAPAATSAPFDRGAAQASLGGVNVASCKKSDGPTGTGHVVVTFGPGGGVQSAVVDSPPFAGTAVGGCVAGKFRGAHVPAFAGSPVKVGKSFSIN